MSFVSQWEGGYVHHPNDPGGATNKGIIQSSYDHWRRQNKLTLRSVKFITDAEVYQLYYDNYWLPLKVVGFDPSLDLVLFDTAVNFGVGGAIRFLQQSLNITADGSAGPVTIAKTRAYPDKQRLAESICVRRINFRYNRVKANPSQNVFLKGWLRRDNALLNTIKNKAE